MSRQQQHHEAWRWLTTAEEDLVAALCLKEQAMYSHSCFLAQQCAEKALKAIWFELDEDPWGHSVQKLMRDIPSKQERERFKTMIEKAAALDRYYIPARYPNGLPDLTPGTTFALSDATLACENAREILDMARLSIGDEPRDIR